MRVQKRLMFAGCISALMAAAACGGEGPGPSAQIEPAADVHEDDNNDTHTTGETIRELPIVDGYRMPTPLAVVAPANRVAFFVTLTQDDVDIAGGLEARGQLGGVWSQWSDIEVVFTEDNLRVARAELPEAAEVVEVRVTEALSEYIADLTFGGSFVGEDDDGFDAVESSETDHALDGALAAAGIISRAQWGARPSGNCSWESGKNRMAIHHTASHRKSSGSYLGMVKALQSYALDGLGYCEAHYNFFVTADGNVYEARPLKYRASHSGGFNTGNIGIVLVGCFDGSTYCNNKGGRDVPQAMMNGAARAVRALSDLYGIGINGDRIKGHGQQPGQWTSCPGSYMVPRLEELRQLAAYNAPVTAPSAPSTHAIYDVSGYFKTGAGYNAIAPARVIDTRNTGGIVSAGTEFNVNVASVLGVNASSVGAVMLNVTVTQTAGPGHIGVRPAGTGFGETSRLNYAAQDTVANMVITPLSSTGAVTVRVAGHASHVIIDAFGYTNTDAAFVAQSPQRRLDTRESGTKVTGAMNITLTGRNGIPSSGVAAVVLNLTVTQPDGPGFATLYKAGLSRPQTSNLNYETAQTQAGAAIVPVNASGQITLYSHASAHYIVDVAGYVPTGGAFVAVNPARLLDSRNDNKLDTQIVRNVGVMGFANVPTTGVAAVFGNVTVTQPSGAGFIATSGAGAAMPETSNLNFAPGETVTNATITTPGYLGAIGLHPHVSN